MSATRPASAGAKVALVALLGVVALVAALVVRATRFTPTHATAPPAAPFAVDRDAAAQRLAAAVRIATVSAVSGDTAVSAPAALDSLRSLLERSFPRVHEALARETVAAQSLLYSWRGTDSALAPLVLMAHMDVVPVEPGTETKWTHAPFGGDVADGYVWGRGAMDDKASLMATLEAVEALLAGGSRPRRTIYLALGHDEEVGGRGAAAIAARLRARGVRPELVLDEGGAVATGMIPGVSTPVALIGVAEKGYASVELSVEGTGGHSSMPPRETAVGVLSAAIARLEAHPMPARIGGATARMFDAVGREMPLGRRVVLANLWLFRPLILRQLAGAPSTDATIRTTTAPTMFEGSVKDNVLPAHARAVVNFRILPGDSVSTVVEHVRRVVDDPRVHVRVLGGFGLQQPSRVSPDDSPAFETVARTVRQVLPGVTVAPYLTVGATDARQYAPFSPNVYRFLPIAAGPTDLARIHGTDERISVANYEQLIRFYAQLIRNASM